ncbi:MAG TPA: DUF6655 family protein [Thermoguttaceae bacterium]|nr:DUF6655 family protein [Thermoguttaceae bacterium]
MAVLFCGVALAGCGTTKWTDTSRTATEQLLISDAMDRAVAKLDLRAVAGKNVWLDSAALKSVTDSPYLVSLLRQHMLASGCVLIEDREDADYVIEVRAGAVGTDRRELTVGIPAVNVPSMLPVPTLPARLPEMNVATKTEQRAVAKIAAFAYNRKTGRPVWQSGVVPVESKAKNVWLFGAGPFEQGTIFEGTKFAGSKIDIPLIYPAEDGKERKPVSVADQAYFSEPEEAVVVNVPTPKTYGLASSKSSTTSKTTSSSESTDKVVAAAHTEPVEPSPPKSPVPPDSDDP